MKGLKKILILALSLFVVFGVIQKANAAVAYQAQQTLTINSGIINTINYAGSGQLVSSVDWVAHTSGGGVSKLTYISVIRDLVVVASTTESNLGAGSCPTTCAFTWSFITPFIFEDGDEIRLNTGAGTADIQANATVGSDYALISLNSSAGSYVSISWLSPTQDEFMVGFPEVYRVNVTTGIDAGLCAYSRSNGNQAHEGSPCSFIPAGTIEWSIPAYLASPTSGLIQANVQITETNGNTELASSTITFRTASSNRVPNGSGFGPNYITGNANASTSPFFVDCSAYQISLFSSSSLAGIGCVAKKTALDVAAFLVVPKPSSTQFLGQQASAFQGVFPFSVFFAIRSTLSDTASTTLSSASSSLTWTLPLGGQNIALSVGSSTLKDAIGTPTYNVYFAFARMLMWIALIFSVWGFIHSHMHS